MNPLNWFRRRDRIDDVIAEAEAEAGVIGETTGTLSARHANLIARGRRVGMDPATLLMLIQLFGPLVVKLIERFLARRGV